VSWRSISTNEVLAEFTPQETASLDRIQGVATSLAGILDRAVNSAWDSIRAGGNTAGPAGTIPDQLRSQVITIARWKWLVSFPQLKMLQTDARKQAAKDAEDLLQLISSQNPDRPRVVGPDSASPLQSPSFSHGRHREFKQNTQDG
jgi:hypothetical protein